jgi:arabinogalactan oligomer / maltooligosaccharide transport system permease protein
MMTDPSISKPAIARKGLFASGRGSGRGLTMGQQLLLQLMCLLIAVTVLFPIVWVVSMSLDGRNISRPTSLQLLPPEPSLNAYREVIRQPTSNPVSFWQLAGNSFSLAAGVSFFSVMIGVTAAYAFSRFNFPGRKLLFLSVGFILLMPGIATLAPLFALLSRATFGFEVLQILYYIFGGTLVAGSLYLLYTRIRDEEVTANSIVIGLVCLVVGALFIYTGATSTVTRAFKLRDSLYGVGFAMISGALPFAIWNLKGYLDTIPKELEEAAIIDGASPNQIFFRIVLPLATPALAVTAFLGFMSGWTEFALSWQFLTQAKDFTLAMSLWNMTGQYAGSVPWSKFAAMSLMISFPVSIVYLFLQKYIIGGLTLGGVKG